MEWIQWIWAQIESATWLAVQIVGIVWLYQCGKDLALGIDVRRTVFKVLALGAAWGVHGSAAFWVGTTSDELLQSIRPVVGQQVASDWGAGTPPEEREENTRIIASMAYVDSGRLLKYVDRTGVWRDYCPTSEDATQLMERTKALTELKSVADRGYESAYQIWIRAFVALITGFLVAKTKQYDRARPGRPRADARNPHDRQ
jgi:hypothetical protein